MRLYTQGYKQSIPPEWEVTHGGQLNQQPTRLRKYLGEITDEWNPVRVQLQSTLWSFWPETAPWSNVFTSGSHFGLHCIPADRWLNADSARLTLRHCSTVAAGNAPTKAVKKKTATKQARMCSVLLCETLWAGRLYERCHINKRWAEMSCCKPVSVAVFGDSMKDAATHPEDETVTVMSTTNITTSHTLASLLWS